MNITEIKYLGGDMKLLQTGIQKKREKFNQVFNILFYLHHGPHLVAAELSPPHYVPSGLPSRAELCHPDPEKHSQHGEQNENHNNIPNTNETLRS